ncbi:MAG TPA: hypothetical protein VLM40_22655 [Gemmata sp.]|nr:hypothetical protein [Gemmata sp.]
MRVAATGLLVFACAALTMGCLSHSRRPTVPAIVRSFAPPIQPDGVILDYVLVEQALSDAFIDRDLWENALPVGQPETRALLAENGLRAGILLGTAPQKLQTLLDSDIDTVSPRRLTFQHRKAAVIPTAAPRDPCRYRVLTDISARPNMVELNDARCGIVVRPELSSNGGVKIWCEPLVQHGALQEWYRPNEDGTQFIKEEDAPTEKYPVLGFEATLGAEDYLLIGCSSDEPLSLGAVTFTSEKSGNPRQRILVIRAHQARPNSGPDLPPIHDPFKLPSPASQAAGKK